MSTACLNSADLEPHSLSWPETTADVRRGTGRWYDNGEKRRFYGEDQTFRLGNIIWRYGCECEASGEKSQASTGIDRGSDSQDAEAFGRNSGDSR